MYAKDHRLKYSMNLSVRVMTHCWRQCNIEPFRLQSCSANSWIVWANHTKRLPKHIDPKEYVMDLMKDDLIEPGMKHRSR
mmetsp:Transcript_26598/g.32231  ORF Transcript_26598/g.32231 Transcript_26598/m.32231 type:complete len:80 (-) Transcript_26598:1610-1849(-)